MRIIGIDPGTGILGFGVIEVAKGNKVKMVTAGVITTPAHTPLDERLEEIVLKIFPVKPAEIIKQLKLERPIYEQTAAYGHFGRTDLNLPWEKLDKVREIKKLARLR